MNAFPFKVHFVNGALSGSPEQMHQILAEFDSPDLLRHKALFDKYGLDEGLLSLVDFTALIIENNSPELLDHLDFNEEGYLLDIYADSEAAVQDFVSNICPAFRDIKELESYVQRIVSE